MLVCEARRQGVRPGDRIRVVGVAEGPAERAHYVNDSERLLHQTGRVEELAGARSRTADVTQIRVTWDEPEPGALMLASHDEIEVI